jgi:hypothetical protein
VGGTVYASYSFGNVTDTYGNYPYLQTLITP